ncbi:MAG TPA: hypothetical protein VE974_22150 [Thermoanaerobaculia bacterium]|nr:hypothetical protein [Thermoanaerobaculia bacterium]
MSARSAAFARLALWVFLCLLLPFAAHAQTCTPPAIQQIVTSPGNCAGEPVTLDAGEGWVTYVWSNDATGRYLTDAPLVNTVYTVTVTDANGCTVTSQPFEVWIEGTNVAPAIDAPDSLCDAAAVQTATMQPPANGGSWGMTEWTITGGHFYDPVGTNPTTASGTTVQFEADGTGPVTLTVHGKRQGDMYCWSPVATKEIALSSTTVTIQAPDEVCPMMLAPASVAPPSQGSWMAYEWTITGGTFSSPYGTSTSTYDSNPAFRIEEGAVEAVLSVRVRDDQGCWTAIASRGVLPRTIEAPEIIAPDEVCPMMLAPASVAPPEQGSWMAYEWTITGGTFSSPYGTSTSTYDSNPAFRIEEGAVEAVLSVRVRDDQGCWSPIASRGVLPRTIAAPEIIAPDEVCPMMLAPASVAPPEQGGWMAYEWTITGGTFSSPYGTSTSTYDSNPAFRIEEGAVEAVLSVRVRDDQGCWSPIATRGVLPRTIAAPEIIAPDEVCPMMLAPASVAPPEQGGWMAYEWTITGGTFSSLYGSSTTTYDYNPTFMIDEGAVEAVLSVRVRDDEGCWSPIATRGVLPRTIAAPQIIAPDEVCPMMLAPASVAPPEQGGWMAYEWSITGGTFSSLYGSSTTTYDYNPTFMIDEGASEAVLSVRVRDDQGCWTPIATRSVLPRTIAAPQIIAPDEVCPMMLAPASVAPPPQGGWMAYEWTIAGGTFSSPSGASTTTYDYNPTFMIDEGASEAVLSVRTRDDQGCWTPIATRSVLVRTIAAPAIEAADQVCPMVPAYATVAPPAQGGWFEYEWSIAGGTFAGGTATATGRNVEYMIHEGATQAVLSVRTRDDQGCWTPISTRTVLVRTIPAPEIEAADEVCPMVPAFATVAPPAQGGWFEYQWSIVGGMFSGGTTTATGRNVEYMIDEGATEAVLSVRTRDDQGCWTPIASRTVLVRTLSAPAIETADEACPMVPAYATVAPPAQGDWFEYEWSIAGGTFAGGTATATGRNVEYMIDEGATEAVLSVRTRDDQGCWTPVATRTVLPRIVAAPVIHADAESCPGGSAAFASIEPPLGGGNWIAYEWSVTNATFDGMSDTTSTEPGVALYLDGSGPATISVRARDTYGCWTPVGTHVVNLRTIAAPVIHADAEACPGGAAAFASIEAPLSGENWIAYEWSVTNATFDGVAATTATTQGVALYLDGSGPATISVRARDYLGCWTPVATHVVNVRTIAAPVIHADPEACPDGAAAFASIEAPLSGENWIAYEWSVTNATFDGVAATTATTQGVAIYLDGSGPATISVRARDYLGCWTPVATHVVNVRTIAAPVIHADPEACPGGSAAFASIEAPLSGENWIAYEWSVTNATFDGVGATAATTQGVAIYLDGSGPATISVRARDYLGCWTPVATHVVNVRTIAAPVIHAEAEACPDGAPSLAGIEGPLSGENWIAHEWSITNGTFDGVGATTSTDPNVTIYLDGSGPATISVRARDYLGCWTPVATHVMNVRTIPPASIVAPAAVCAGGEGMASIAGSEPWIEYVWTIDGGTFDGTGATTATSSSVTFYPSGTGPVTLSARVRDQMGCWTPISTATVSVNPRPAAGIRANSLYGDGDAQVVSQANGVVEVCGNGMIGLLPEAVYEFNPAYTYLWSNGWDRGSLNVSASGTYSVTVTTPNGCSTTSTVVVNFSSYPAKPSIATPNGTQLCPAGGSITLTAPAASGWTWSNGATTQSIVVTEAGSYSVRVRSGYCESQPSDAVVVTNGQSSITAGGPLALCENESVTLTANNGTAWLWSNGATTRAITISQPGTYSVTTTNNSCVADESAPVTVVRHHVSIAAEGPATFCPGGSVTLTADSDAGALYWSHGPMGASVVVTEPGTYFVTAHYTGGCSIVSNAIVVTVPETTVTIAADRTAVCPGGAIALTSSASGSSGYTYQWYQGLTYDPIDGATSPSLTIHPATSGFVYLKVTDETGCVTTSNTVLYTVNPPPDATITPSGPTTWCGESSVTLTAPDGLTYLWSTGATTQSITVDASGSFHVTVDNGSCSVQSATVVVTENALPDATVTPGGPLTWCGEGSVTLSAPAGLTYVWSNGATSQSITVDASGSFYVDVNNGTCTARSATVVVTEHALPDATITPSGPLTWCGESSVTLTAPAGLTYVWSNGAGSRSITVDASGSFYVDVNNGNCTVRSATVVVTENALPDATITPSGPLTWCGEGSVTLTAPAGLTYSWSNGAISQSITVDASGSFYVDVNNGNCTLRSATVVVTENALPDATITPSGPLTWCGEGSVTLTAPAGLTYLWSNGAISQSIAVDASGSFYVDVNNGNCTVRSATVVVTENALPDATITPSGPLTWCGESTVTLTAPAGLTYLWSNGAISQSITVDASGSFYVDVNNGNCTLRSATVVVTENALPDATVTPSGPLTWCGESTVTLTAPAGLTYLWSNGAISQSITVDASGSFYVDVNNGNCTLRSATVVVTENALPDATVTPSGPLTWCGESSVTLTAPAGLTYLWSNGAISRSITVDASGSFYVDVNNGNCTVRSATVVVTENALPNATITPSGPLTWCGQSTVTLTAPAGLTYLWSNGAISRSITVDASGSFYVDVNNGNCTVRSSTVVVTENPLPNATVTVTGSLALCPGASVTLGAQPGYTYVWSNGSTQQSITVSTPGQYHVTVSNGSCTLQSQTYTVSAQPATVITQQPLNTTMPRNQQRTLTVNATAAGGPTFKWYEVSSSGVETALTSPSSNTNQLLVGPYSKKGTFRFRVYVGSATCTTAPKVPSNIVTVTVN